MDMHEIAELVAGRTATVRLRQGEVTAVSSDGTLSVLIGGSGTEVTGVKAFTSACPVVGAGVWLVTDGADLIAIGTIGASAPYAIVVGSGVTWTETSTWTPVSFGATPALLSGPSGFYSASNPTRLTVPAGMGGLYQVVGCLRFASSGTGQRLARIRLNAATSEVYASSPAFAGEPALNPVVFVPLEAGDYLELQGWQDSGESLQMTQLTPTYPRLSMCRLRTTP